MEWLIMAMIFFGISGFLNLFYYGYEKYLRLKEQHSHHPFSENTINEVSVEIENSGHRLDQDRRD